MSNYQKGKIYKIISQHTDKIYIGSTCQLLCRRLSNHKTKYNTTSSYEILKYGDAKIILIENYPCNNKEELTSKEAEYIKLYNSNIVNVQIPGRSNKEYYQDNKTIICEKIKDYRYLNREIISEKQKQYRNNNKDKISEQHKQYRNNNKDIISKQNKQYRNNNKDKISEQHKQYRNNNKDIISEKKKQYREINKDKIRLKRREIKICECGSNTSTSHYLRHKRTLIHQQNLSKIIYTKIVFID